MSPTFWSNESLTVKLLTDFYELNPSPHFQWCLPVSYLPSWQVVCLISVSPHACGAITVSLLRFLWKIMTLGSYSVIACTHISLYLWQVVCHVPFWLYPCGEITVSLCVYLFPDFYEEVLALIFSMTCTHISPPLWQVFQMMYDTFQDDMYDYFVGK